MREHDVTALTARELDCARRELAASLAPARAGSPARAPILAHLTAIDTELGPANRPAACQPARLPERLSPDDRRAARR